jgi:5'-3' exonuclease
VLYNNIIIDTNNLYWRQVITTIKQTLKDENDEREFYSASIQDTLTRIQELIKQFGALDCKVYFLCDNPFSKINQRSEIYSSYKHARKNKNIPPVFYKSLDKFIEILKIFNDNFYIVRESGYEADDLIPIVLNHIERNWKGNTLLISADLDWARAIENSIDWFNFNTVYTINKFKEEYGFTPNNNGVKMYKCIHGDSSDCIENAVPYLPKNILLYIVNTYSSLEHLFSNLWSDTIIPKQWKLKIKEYEVQLKINYQLVDYSIIDNISNEIILNCYKDIDKLRSWFTLLDIPYFNWMRNKNDTDLFFEKKKLRRYSNF